MTQQVDALFNQDKRVGVYTIADYARRLNLLLADRIFYTERDSPHWQKDSVAAMKEARERMRTHPIAHMLAKGNIDPDEIGRKLDKVELRTWETLSSMLKSKGQREARQHGRASPTVPAGLGKRIQDLQTRQKRK